MKQLIINCNKRCFVNGTFEEKRSTSQTSIRLGGDVETSDNLVVIFIFIMLMTVANILS